MTALHVPQVAVKNLVAPSLFFTVHGGGKHNPRSLQVLSHMARTVASESATRPYLAGVECRVYACPEEAKAASADAVEVVDDVCRNYFSFRPGSNGTQWQVVVGAKCSPENSRLQGCANNALGVFVKQFRRQIDQGCYPWGPPKKGSLGPRDIVALDLAQVNATLVALNRGPNLARAIASKAFAADLPKDSRISWMRVPPAPLGYSESTMRGVVNAMRSLERACGRLIKESPEVRRQILAGVSIPDERLHAVYTDPRVDCFSVARPDIHWNDSGVNVSENDEMPGGMPELVHIDASYGVNEERWTAFFDWLTARGPLVFVVSHQWSSVYVPEITWLVEYLQGKGYSAHLVTTDNLHELTVDDGVFYRGSRVGTLWRQFPIFETSGMLAELVLAAHEGKVRMVPEFAHYGNKTWFHVFCERKAWFRSHLAAEEYELLCTILPESHFVESGASFPFRVGSSEVSSIEQLASLPQEARDRLVLKICGANTMAARSYGVLMGEGISLAAWALWIRNRMEQGEPFLVQARFETGVVRMPVYHTGKQQAEMFLCRLLMRPWVYGDGVIVSVHGCAVPQQYFKVHGMVDMAVVPVVLTA